MDNRIERTEGEIDYFDPLIGKDSINTGVKKRKNRREKDTIRKITKEWMKDWRDIDFEKEER
ncbi:MAG: hypothetical protein HY578_00135 [Nitrospinae bacterium]|nr:hypothetical protein [Nitrospinota bacterium]